VLIYLVFIMVPWIFMNINLIIVFVDSYPHKS